MLPALYRHAIYTGTGHYFGSGFIDSGSVSSVLGWIPTGSRVLMTKIKKNVQLEKIDIFLIKY
jgi:hypothetical protein